MGKYTDTKRGEKMDMNVEVIGRTAGQVWSFLNENPNASLSAVERGVNMPSSTVHMALGWLAREGKIQVAREGRGLRFWLIEM
jgi:predicted transcriptional regulator